MNGSDPPEDLTPAERALERHLELLCLDGPVPPVGMDRHIIHRARWQRTIRRPLLILGHFARAFGDGLRLLFAPAGQR
jgi:hypothetical protein